MNIKKLLIILGLTTACSNNPTDPERVVVYENPVTGNACSMVLVDIQARYFLRQLGRPVNSDVANVAVQSPGVLVVNIPAGSDYGRQFLLKVNGTRCDIETIIP